MALNQGQIDETNNSIRITNFNCIASNVVFMYIRLNSIEAGVFASDENVCYANTATRNAMNESDDWCYVIMLLYISLLHVNVITPHRLLFLCYSEERHMLGNNNNHIRWDANL